MLNNEKNINNVTLNYKVEYDRIPIRHLAVQCPECDRWFNANDIVLTPEKIRYYSELVSTLFKCPVCFSLFGRDYKNKRNIVSRNLQRLL